MISKTAAKAKLKKLYYNYNNMDEGSRVAVKIDNEIEYLEAVVDGYVVCNDYCEQCRFESKCVLRRCDLGE